VGKLLDGEVLLCSRVGARVGFENLSPLSQTDSDWSPIGKVRGLVLDGFWDVERCQGHRQIALWETQRRKKWAIQNSLVRGTKTYSIVKSDNTFHYEIHHAGKTFDLETQTVKHPTKIITL
jgi:hypothetical protein